MNFLLRLLIHRAFGITDERIAHMNELIRTEA